MTFFLLIVCFCFFFNDTATTEIYTLSLHDALPISGHLARAHRPDDQHGRPLRSGERLQQNYRRPRRHQQRGAAARDRKSTRLNSSHSQISYAVFCLKKKKKKNTKKKKIKSKKKNQQ